MSPHCKCKKWKVNIGGKFITVEADVCIIKPEGALFFARTSNNAPLSERSDLELIKAFASWSTVERVW